MEANEKIETLVRMGGREWVKGDYHRVYFPAQAVLTIAGVNEIGAYIPGVGKMSKAWMGKCQGGLEMARPYYNVADGAFYAGTMNDAASGVWDIALGAMKAAIA